MQQCSSAAVQQCYEEGTVDDWPSVARALLKLFSRLNNLSVACGKKRLGKKHAERDGSRELRTKGESKWKEREGEREKERESVC